VGAVAELGIGIFLDQVFVKTGRLVAVSQAFQLGCAGAVERVAAQPKLPRNSRSPARLLRLFHVKAERRRLDEQFGRQGRMIRGPQRRLRAL
jgi:hypothetical protein